MIEQFLIFTKGGIVLWAKSADALKGDPVNNLIRQVLLQVVIYFFDYFLFWFFGNKLQFTNFWLIRQYYSRFFF